MQVPFYPAGASHLDRTGDYWSAPFGDPAYRIARWRPGGDTTLLLQTQRPNLPVTPDEKDSALNAILEGLKQYGVSTLDASKVPSVKPAVLSLFTDDEGRLWVQTASPDSLNRYDVYERNGRYAGTAVSSINVFRYVSPLVRGDRFYAVALDDLDVPYIVRARLTSAPQPNQ